MQTGLHPLNRYRLGLDIDHVPYFAMSAHPALEVSVLSRLSPPFIHRSHVHQHSCYRNYILSLFDKLRVPGNQLTKKECDFSLTALDSSIETCLKNLIQNRS